MGTDHRILPDGDWIQHIRRETDREDLFLYHHAYTAQFVLATWIYPPWEVTMPICLELDTMPKPPDRGGWIPTEVVKLRCRAIDPEQNMMEKQLRANNAAERAEKMQGYERKNEMVEYLKRKGKIEEASSLHASKVHYSENSEMRDSLNELAKGKIITHG